MNEEERKRRHAIAVKKWQKKNWAKVLEDQRRLRAANPDRMKAQSKKQYYKNRLKSIACTRRWQERNQERVKAVRAAWRKKNQHLRTAKQSLRKATKLRATPAWANDFFIKEIYHLAALRTKMLDFKWHVDHIIPLQSLLVCGLHVENNLQVIPAVKNIAKLNRQWPDMP